MTKPSIRLLATASLAVLLTLNISAQKGKVQSAWRNLTDYEETWKDGNPDKSLLTKASEAIDLALQNEATSKQTKTHAYKLRICYAQYQLKLNEEIKRLESTISDKNERNATAYGNVSLEEFEQASEQLRFIRENDPKYFETIQQAILKGNGSLDEDDLKLATAVQLMKMEVGNIATGRYKLRKYDEAAGYFYRAAQINSMVSNIKDTANYLNATISAAKAKNAEKVYEYNVKMIEAGVPMPSNYESLYNNRLEKGDTITAADWLKKGREKFPDNLSLITAETNYFLAKGKTKEALNNVNIALEKDPKNGFLTLFAGNLYDNLANPKDNAGRDAPKPDNFDELFKKAETYYKRAIELNSANKGYLYNAYFDLGAMYNNHGGYITNRKPAKLQDMVKVEKENEAAAMVYFKQAIPNLEKALELKPDDIQSMKALRLLYMKTGDQTKANEMNERIRNPR